MSRHQISASLTLDVASLADAIAERLAAATPALVELDRRDAVEALHEADRAIVLDRLAAAGILTRLAAAGYVLARKSEAGPDADPSDRWFSPGRTD